MKSIKEIRDLISENKIEIVINELEERFDKNPLKRDLIISIKSQHNNLKHENIRGVITYEDKKVGKNQITNKLLALIADEKNQEESRIYTTVDNKSINQEKLPIFKDNYQKTNNLWNALDNKYFIDSENISILLRGILWHSKHSKTDFASLAGIEMNRLESLLKGDILPSLEELIRVSRLVELDIKFFFRPNINGREPIWKSDMVRYSIFKLIHPVSTLSQIKDVDKFLGYVFYQTAKNICYFHSLIFNKHDNMTNSEFIPDNQKIVEAYKKIPDLKRSEFLGELAHQHYKLLEQVIEKDYKRGFTKREEVILLWHSHNPSSLARIFTESIKKITVLDKEKYNITFHFWDELITKKIRGRTYDDKNIKMIFSKIKLKL